MNFVFDENTSRPLVDLMKHMGAANICHLLEHYPSGTKDPEFLPWVAAQNYVLVTCDRAMRKAHKDVMEKHKVKALFLPRAYAETYDGWKQAEFMFKYWLKIAMSAERLKYLSTKVVTINGNLNDT
jgi:hypothetical protein